MIKEEVNNWLKEGEQSKITPNIQEICSQFNGSDLNKIFQIVEWISKNIKAERDQEKVMNNFATRNVEQIIRDKTHSGCQDTAAILTTFLRTNKIPSKYLVGIDKINPKNKGHCVVEAYLDDRWILIDQSSFQINLIPQISPFYKNYFFVKQGLDSWDCGIKTFDDWKNISNKVIEKISEI